jgi:D-glycero-alpha-D-manno-heptose-7-phosphate kinase
MIIVRSPLRISIGGGGTDLPIFYKNNNGTVFSSLSINKYIYISITKRFQEEVLIRYLENEEVKDLRRIKHDIFRETLLNIEKNINSIEITSTSDVPGGTGLGSSGAFGVALQMALRSYLKLPYSKDILSKESTRIEMDILKRPIGLQDQYISAYGSLTEFRVDKKSNVKISQPAIDADVESVLSNNLLLFYANKNRDASTILKSDQKKMSDTKKKGSFVDIVADVSEYGKLMHDYWLIKRDRQKQYTDKSINDLYDHIFHKKLAYGGKLVGAGGGGFLLFATDCPERLRKEMKNVGMKELEFSRDFEGAKLIEV